MSPSKNQRLLFITSILLVNTVMVKTFYFYEMLSKVYKNILNNRNQTGYFYVTKGNCRYFKLLIKFTRTISVFLLSYFQMKMMNKYLGWKVWMNIYFLNHPPPYNIIIPDFNFFKDIAVANSIVGWTTSYIFAIKR